eukprot:TRINITY_DN1922_c0_g1_i14.p1 TRINITY_DN1922_c0_g1~~TRINITY_DN1922_c0_g1_i14.p1  ORF type:complete len:144 (-),score=41.61 TRINITY_DN1922_c0_g1_i14:53-484(-)
MSTGDGNEEWSQGKLLGTCLSIILTICVTLGQLSPPESLGVSKWNINTATIFSLIMIPLAAYPAYYALLPSFITSLGRATGIIGLSTYLSLTLLNVILYFVAGQVTDYYKVTTGILWGLFHGFVCAVSYLNTCLLYTSPSPRD